MAAEDILAAFFKIGRKITALGFIIVILMGNFWLVEYFFLQKVHQLIEISFFVGMVMAVLGGLVMALSKAGQMLKSRF